MVWRDLEGIDEGGGVDAAGGEGEEALLERGQREGAVSEDELGDGEEAVLKGLAAGAEEEGGGWRRSRRRRGGGFFVHRRRSRENEIGRGVKGVADGIGLG